MAAFPHLSAQQQYVSSFVNNNPYPVTEAAVIPPANLPPPPATHSNNAEVFSVGRKRKASDDQQLNGVPFKHPAQQFFCEICSVQLNSLSQASQHKEGKIHKLNATKRDLLNSMDDSNQEINSSCGLDQSSLPAILPKGQTKQTGNVSRECVVCHKTFNSKTQAEQHFNGQAHKRKLQALLGSNKTDPSISQNINAPLFTKQPEASTLVQQQPEETVSADATTCTTKEEPVSSEKVAANELYCEFCGLEVNSKIQMDMHLQGAKHKNAVTRAAMLPVINCAKNSSSNLLYCEDCNTNFNSQSQLVQHLMSPKHINRVNRAQKQQTAGQFGGGARGTGCGQAKGRGVSRGGSMNRGRGRATFPTPPISASFVKPTSNLTNTNIQGYAFYPPGQAANYTQNFTAQNPAFQQSFV